MRTFIIEITFRNKDTFEVVVLKYRRHALAMGSIIDKLYIDNDIQEYLIRGFYFTDIEVHEYDDKN